MSIVVHYWIPKLECVTMIELKTSLRPSLVCKGSSSAKVMKKMDVRTNVLTFVKRALSAVDDEYLVGSWI